MNILILTGSFGMGHNSAAYAIAEKIKAQYDDANIHVEDLFSETLKMNNYSFPYYLFVKYGKSLYNYAYRLTEDSGVVTKLPFNTYFLHVLHKLVDRSGADLIISTYSGCSKVVSEYKLLTGSDVPFFSCITDVALHATWLQPGTDLYFVAAPATKDELAAKGVDPERIVVSGVPVRGEFERVKKSPAPRAEKRLLIMGGGLGLLPKTKDFYEAVNRLPGVKTTVLAGKNEKLFKCLDGKFEHIEVLPFVDDMPRVMSEADLLLSKPGGITMFEAISAELPLLIFPPFLQQEMKNGDFIVENGIGDVLPDDEGAWVEKIREMLSGDGRLARVRENMRALKTIFDEDALLGAIRKVERQCA
ncbi:MAG TPA: glycosyltransferase [Candidatus Acidoferrum sp.]|nr:glycosyltransferase [Candidatus Acidoferrum sp.]